MAFRGTHEKKNAPCKSLIYRARCINYSGKTGIRTLGTRKGTTVFETVPFDRSGIFPWSCLVMQS